MPTKVIMPQLGESVVEGTVVKWLIQEGQPVEEYESLMEISTDKVATEIPAPATGMLLKQYVGEGETVKAGTLLAVIGEEGDDLAKIADELPTKPAGKTTTPIAPLGGQTGKVSSGIGFVSPVVARMAAEYDLDLGQVRGTGRAGRITKKDVISFLKENEAPAPSPAPWEEPASGELFRPTEELLGLPTPRGSRQEAGKPKDPTGELIPIGDMRRAIADHMVRSRRTSPHVTTVMEADMLNVVTHRDRNRAGFDSEEIKLTFTAYFAVAAAAALKQVPMVNSSWTEDGIHLHPDVNLGLAVSIPEGGLIVPVIRKAENLSLRGMARVVNDIAARARTRKLDLDEVQGGTFTITNHGVGRSLFAMPIINQPQVGILGVGAIQKRVAVVGGGDRHGNGDSIAIRPMVYLSLTFDHRVLDGAIADTFLAAIVDTLEKWS